MDTLKGYKLLFTLFAMIMIGSAVIDGTIVLSLTEKFHLQENQAYFIFGSYKSLIFILSIFGGWLGSKYCNPRTLVLFGLSLITIGFLLLSLQTLSLIPLGLAFICCGRGLTVPNGFYFVSELINSNNKSNDL